MNCRALAQGIVVNYKKIYRGITGCFGKIPDIVIRGFECIDDSRLKLPPLRSPAIDLLWKFCKTFTNWARRGSDTPRQLKL